MIKKGLEAVILKKEESEEVCQNQPKLKNSKLNNEKKRNYIKNIRRLNTYANNPNFNTVVNNFKLNSIYIKIN